MDDSTRKNRHLRKVCGHCGESLSYSAYLSHRRLYYDTAKEVWMPSENAAAHSSPSLVTGRDEGHEVSYSNFGKRESV